MGPLRRNFRTYKHGREELEMFAFFDYCRLRMPHHPAYALAWHVPNENRSSIQRRASLARAGLKKGAPDITVPYPSGKYGGLYIEMKVKPNKPSPEQLALIAALNKAGNFACVCWNAEEAILTLETYLALKA
ncbi:MAG: VRR-NUC domain-containing protein [Enterovibrio sp.]